MAYPASRRVFATAPPVGSSPMMTTVAGSDRCIGAYHHPFQSLTARSFVLVGKGEQWNIHVEHQMSKSERAGRFGTEANEGNEGRIWSENLAARTGPLP